jgi:hypothetical protein
MPNVSPASLRRRPEIKALGRGATHPCIEIIFDRMLTTSEMARLEEHIRLIFDGQVVRES